MINNLWNSQLFDRMIHEIQQKTGKEIFILRTLLSTGSNQAFLRGAGFNSMRLISLIDLFMLQNLFVS